MRTKPTANMTVDLPADGWTKTKPTADLLGHWSDYGVVDWRQMAKDWQEAQPQRQHGLWFWEA